MVGHKNTRIGIERSAKNTGIRFSYVKTEKMLKIYKFSDETIKYCVTVEN